MSPRQPNALQYACLQCAKVTVNASSKGRVYCSNRRSLHVDGRNRLSTFWAPTGGIAPQTGEDDDSHSLLIRGGFLRQAHSGVFHLLPLGLRVQDKLEQLIDKHMRSIGASKLSLSSISTEDLWRRSGRYSANSELLRLEDRKDSGFLLSPTHEEEITVLASGIVKSYKDLPLRLYQISRKYRDERRPRQGLLRTKEFLMKDLYTFDYSPELALNTYKDVRDAYSALFNELKVPYLVADADSGAMGGNLSHEYHFISPKGEDNIWSCKSCSYVANEELVEKGSNVSTKIIGTVTWHGISIDRKTRVEVWAPKFYESTGSGTLNEQAQESINLHAVKAAYPDIDTGLEDGSRLRFVEATNLKVVRLFDHRILRHSTRLRPSDVSTHPKTGEPLDLTRIQTGDPCPRCSDGTLDVQRAIEVGHTFHLGTRYSELLNALVTTPTGQTPVQMGCHGIGVSRLIGAVASLLSDSRGLNWPRAIAPFECVIIPTRGAEEDAIEVYDELSRCDDPPMSTLSPDLILDDRPIKELAWKLRDADLIGYPIIVVLGRAWKKEGKVELQCRRLGFKHEVGLRKLKGAVLSVLGKL